MAKKDDDHNNKKASTEKQASPKKTGKQQHTDGSAFRVPVKLAFVPENMFSWGVRMDPSRGDDVLPNMLPVWNVNDTLDTSAISQPSPGQAVASVPVAVSSDRCTRGDHATQQISSVNPTTHAPETRAEEATSSRISGSNPDIYGTLQIPRGRPSRLLPPVPLPTLHPHSFHDSLYASPSPRFHPYHPPRPRPPPRQATQLDGTHVSLNGGRNPSRVAGIPSSASNAQAQVRSASPYLPPPSVDLATGTFFWPGTLNLAGLHGLDVHVQPVQEQALGLDIGHPPSHVPYGHAGGPLQQGPFAYSSTLLPEETSFYGQNAVAGPSSRPLDDPLMAGHDSLYRAGNARTQWAVPQDQWNPGWSSQPVAGPSWYEEPPAELGPLDVEGLSEFSPLADSDCILRPHGGSPPPPLGSHKSQWQW